MHNLHSIEKSLPLFCRCRISPILSIFVPGKEAEDCEDDFERWITNLKNMSTYINRGNSEFRDIVAHEYVDKTSLIPIINTRLSFFAM